MSCDCPQNKLTSSSSSFVAEAVLDGCDARQQKRSPPRPAWREGHLKRRTTHTILPHRRLMLLLLLLAASRYAAGVTIQPSTHSSRGCYTTTKMDPIPRKCERFVFSVFAAPALMGGDELNAGLLECARVDAVVEGSGTAQAHIRVNGVDLGLEKLVLSEEIDQTRAQVRLPLRSGLNVVTVSAPTTHCMLSLSGAMAPSPVGATLPFVELEAENATSSTGSLLGPSFAFGTLAAEASSRMAVQLRPGEYLDFTVPAGSDDDVVNAIALRFSIPDAGPPGGGIETNITVLLNGQTLLPTLTLTSTFSWLYGDYPFTKDPTDGGAHHFYDTVSAWLPRPAQPGDVLRILNPAVTPQRNYWHPHDSSTTSRGDNASCTVPNPAKTDCGFNGINSTICVARGCCWVPVQPNPTHIPWCFHTAPPPPPPTPTPGNVTVTIDLLDLFSVPSPTPEPPGALSVISFGADPTGHNDSTAALQAAVDAGAASSVTIFVPPGTYVVSSHIVLPHNTTLLGAGPWYSVLSGPHAGLWAGVGRLSVNVHVQGLRIDGRTTYRIDTDTDGGITGGGFTDSVFADLEISHTKCGAWLDGPFDSLLMTGLNIHDTQADGVNFHAGVTNSVVEQSFLRNTGDDQLAMWSEAPHADVNNTFRFNSMVVPVLANGIAVYGGSGNSVLGNSVADTLVSGGGLHIGNRFNSVPLFGQTTFADNLVVRGGQMDPGFEFGVGAVWLYALDADLTGNVLFFNNTIVDSPYEAFQFLGPNRVENVVVQSAAVHGVGTYIFQLQANGSAIVSGVVADGPQVAGVYECGSGDFKIDDAGGNVGWNATPHCVGGVR